MKIMILRRRHAKFRGKGIAKMNSARLESSKTEEVEQKLIL